MGKTTWRMKEYIALISSWICVSEDKTHGKNQKAGSLWSRVHKVYEEAQAENSAEINERNYDSLKGRFKRLNENVNKWVVAFNEAHGRKRSRMRTKTRS
ncbi:hypothetical protein ACS0TY_025191 [Phlomoides rotata]